LHLSVAIILTLPNRELAAISTFDLPKTKQTGAFKIDAFVYLDRKNKPSDKTGLVASGDINIQKQAGSLNGEIKFIYPSQSKVRYEHAFFFLSKNRVLNLHRANIASIIEITSFDPKEI